MLDIGYIFKYLSKPIFTNGGVAQLARASDSYSLGPGFKSLHRHHKKQKHFRYKKVLGNKGLFAFLSYIFLRWLNIQIPDVEAHYMRPDWANSRSPLRFRYLTAEAIVTADKTIRASVLSGKITIDHEKHLTTVIHGIEA